METNKNTSDPTIITIEIKSVERCPDKMYVYYCTPDDFSVVVCDRDDYDGMFVDWLIEIFDKYDNIKAHYTGRKSYLGGFKMKSLCKARGIGCYYVDKSDIHVIGCDTVREGRWIHRSSWLQRKYGAVIENKKCITVVFMYYWLCEKMFPEKYLWFELFP